MSKVNVLLEGPIGTGKTHALRSCIDAGKKVFVLATEPGIASVLGDVTCEQGLHWHYVEPAHTEWKTMIDNARLVNSNSMDQLQRQQAPNRYQYQQFIEVLNTCANFTCDRCGEEFGPIDGENTTFDESCVFAVDGLSGLSQMSLDLTCGAKPIKTQPEWGVAMDQVKRIVYKWCSDTKCNFVLIAHVERLKDELTGGTFVTVSTLGNKLAPDIPKPFDEVIMTKRLGSDKFIWSTTEAQTDLKARILPFSDELKPDFAQFWKDK